MRLYLPDESASICQRSDGLCLAPFRWRAHDQTATLVSQTYQEIQRASSGGIWHDFQHHLDVKCPFTLLHDRFARAIFFDAINLHLWGSNHKVHVSDADVSPRGFEFFIVQFFSAGKREAIGASDRDVT